jgi:hypothetical protein
MKHPNLAPWIGWMYVSQITFGCDARHVVVISTPAGRACVAAGPEQPPQSSWYGNRSVPVPK